MTDTLEEKVAGDVFTDERMTRHDLERVAELEYQLDTHDCHLSEADGCTCLPLREELEQLRGEV